MYKVTMLNAVSAGSNVTSAATIFEYPNGLNGVKHVCEKGNMKLNVVSTGNGTTATCKILISEDGINYTYLQDSGSDYVLPLPSATTFYSVMPYMDSTYVKIDYLKGDNTTGEITATLTFN
jgi:hypothetical protein